MSSLRTLLLIEDDRDLRAAVAEMLEDEGYSVVQAANGREGLDALRTGGDFCVVLLDMRMPVMNGVEFRREQLRDPRIAKVEVVAFSAAPEEREEAVGLGIRFAIPKPIQLLELLESVAEHCGSPAGIDDGPKWAVGGR
jgi:CheY-like chemotaxis protein